MISAHGFHLVDRNMAGLIIGSEPTLGFDLGQMPPLFCHSQRLPVGAARRRPWCSE